jgi:hypothetical protein
MNSWNVFLLLFMVLWVPISAMLSKRAVLTLLHAFVFLGLRIFPPFFFLLCGLHCFSLEEVFVNYVITFDGEEWTRRPSGVKYLTYDLDGSIGYVFRQQPTYRYLLKNSILFFST